MFSLPYEPRTLTATEARLEAIYNAAKRGLKGDALALAAGMLPVEYRRLCQFDPIAEMAELKGRADGEMEMSGVLHEAARNGDARAALDILKHVHGWVAKQSIEVQQTVSVKHALEMAQQRVERYLEVDYDTVFSGGGDGPDGALVERGDQGRPAEVRDVLVPVGPAEHAP